MLSIKKITRPKHILTIAEIIILSVNEEMKISIEIIAAPRIIVPSRLPKNTDQSGAL